MVKTESPAIESSYLMGLRNSFSKAVDSDWNCFVAFALRWPSLPCFSAASLRYFCFVHTFNFIFVLY